MRDFELEKRASPVEFVFYAATLSPEEKAEIFAEIDAEFEKKKNPPPVSRKALARHALTRLEGISSIRR